VRVELLDLLSQGDRTVEELARMSGQTLANASQHLQVLLRARLVNRVKEGLFAHYHLAVPEVGEFIRALRVLAERQAVQLEHAKSRLVSELHEAEPVSQEELVRRVREGEAFVIDVRPSEEYHAGHLPGAISVPLEGLEARLAQLPREREIVAYCRGPYCMLAVEAVRRLREKGFYAVRLDLGVWDWRARGLPLEAESVPAVKESK
jgi:rhodanese-related sulfurtransferase